MDIKVSSTPMTIYNRKFCDKRWQHKYTSEEKNSKTLPGKFACRRICTIHLVFPRRTWHARARACRVCACAPARINAEIGAVGMERVARARHERGPREAPATRGAGGYGAIHSRGRQERPTTIGRTREETCVVADSAPRHVLFLRAEKCQTEKVAAIVRHRKRSRPGTWNRIYYFRY